MFHNLIKQGFIPGPGEDQVTFFKRVEKLAVHSFEEIEVGPFRPTFIPVFYEDKGLYFWEGAAIWIEGKEIRVQLKKSLKKGSYLWLYNKKEILKHEAIHAMRMAFNEPKFEEFLAYQTSSHAFRRLLGPLFTDTKEVCIFFILLLPLSFLTPWAFLLFVPLLTRLLRRHLVFYCCLKKFGGFFAPLLFLKDEEIELFAKMENKAIREYIDSCTSPRLSALSEFLSKDF